MQVLALVCNLASFSTLTEFLLQGRLVKRTALLSFSRNAPSFYWEEVFDSVEVKTLSQERLFEKYGKTVVPSAQDEYISAFLALLDSPSQLCAIKMVDESENRTLGSKKKNVTESESSVCI